MSEQQSHSCQTPADLGTTELQFPVSYMDCLLQEDQYVHTLSSSTTDFLFSTLDYLTDYILDLVGTEANTGGMQTTSQDVEGAVDNNAEPHRQVKDTAYALFDEMPGSRRNG
ncbi:Huntingtin-interacting protein M [Camelus dromedarius]|uniref:Huntingtin-interacting protein M n=1 Tax=Camelus dromedarius TaxID=9838 RepID=A0A5N4C2A5_CAMDR|nr:Huntingtin-interacting protein M [Camelus dromedarius]